jgi:predicted dehydrogenase
MTARPHLSRRHFLKSTSAFVAGAPLILRSNVWAATTPPSERLTLGFIGLGHQARGLLTDFINRPTTQVVAVCEVDTTRREAAKNFVNDFYAKQSGKEPHKSCAAYVDFRELLARPDIDAVVIATPDHWHAIIAIAAANAGKDIYCEKPLSQSIHEAQAMVRAVRKNKRVFQTGSMQRSMREFRTAVELVRNGVLGKINHIDVAVWGPAVPCDLPEEPMEPGLDWDRWLGPAPARPYNAILSPRGVPNFFPRWRKYREFGGGGVSDWGAHHFDIAQWAMNMDDSGPVEIFPAEQPNAISGVRFVYANGTEVVHRDGNDLNFHDHDIKPAAERKENGVTFSGTEGKLYVDRKEFELWIGPKQKADSPASLDAIEAEFLSGKDTKHVANCHDHHGDWIDCIRTRQKPIADVAIGAHTANVCQLVDLAYYHNQPMKWDPKHEKFTHGTGDPKWLDVNYRDPWKLPKI